MSTYSNDAIAKMDDEYDKIQPKHDALLEAYLLHNFNHDQAREYARHGFLRRLGTLVHCIKNVFRLLPPESTVLPTDDDRADATIALQAFIVNIYGCFDNLAWVLVYEQQIKDKDGSDLPKGQVGLRKSNKAVRGAVSAELRNYLNSLDEWFEVLESYRHSLAHRIPLYIPPYMVFYENEQEYNRLEQAKTCASSNRLYDLWEKLVEQQSALGIFRPEMGHSFNEKHPRVLFHPQMLADYSTIDKLAHLVLMECKK